MTSPQLYEAHLVSAVLQAAQQRQQIGLGEEVPAAALPGVAQQRGHGPCSGDMGQWDGVSGEHPHSREGMLQAGCPYSRGGWPFFLSGLQVSVQVSKTAARRSRAVFFLW